MRVVELGRIAAQAELLRWRSLARRHAMRAVFGAVGATFATAALACGHVAGVVALVPRVGLLEAVLIVGGADLAIALICFAVAARDQPSRIEREAIAVRDEARAQLVRSVAISAVVVPAVRRAAFLLIERLFRRRSAP